MLDFENKPIKDWTLVEAKLYCINRRNEQNICCLDNNCLLRTHNICAYEPKHYKILLAIPKFTPDKIAFYRLIKKTHPWAKYIVRSKMSLMYFELKPKFSDNGYLYSGKTGKYIQIDEELFPQIKRSTYYAIDNIIKQGENNERN